LPTTTNNKTYLKLFVWFLSFCHVFFLDAQTSDKQFINRLSIEYQNDATNALRLIDSTFRANNRISESLETELFIWKAGAHIYLNQFDSTRFYGELALNNFSPFSDLSLARAKLFTSVAFYYQGDYQRSIPLLLEGLAEPALNQDQALKLKMLRTIGEFYRASDNLDPALGYLKEGLALANTLDDVENKAFILNRLGVVYYQKREHEIAEKYLDQSMQIGQEYNFDRIITMNMNDLGELYFATEDFGKSLVLYELALSRESDDLVKINTLNNMARLELKLDRLDDAIVHGLQAFRLAQGAKVLTYQVDAAKNIADTYEEKKDYPNATAYYNKYIMLREQLFEEEKNRQIVEVETKYQTAQKNQEIQMLTERELNERNQKRVYAIGLILVSLVVLILIALLIYIRNQNKLIAAQNSKLDELNETKTKFFSIIAHDLRSPMIGLQGVGQKLDFFIRKNKQEKLLDLGGQIDQSIDRLNHLLNNLLNWASLETNSIPFKPERLQLKELVQENIDLYKSLADAKEITLLNKIKEGSVYADINTVSSVIRNLLSNAIKFTPAKGEVSIKGFQDNEFVGFTIKDQGQGFTEAQLHAFNNGKMKSTVGTNNEKGFGLGLKLCKEFVELNNGSIDLQSCQNNGASFRVTLPTKTASNP